MTTAINPTRSHHNHRRPSVAPARAGALAYLGAWIVGLTAFGAGPAADASDATLARYVAEHRAATAAQSIVVHGIAAAALAVVLVTARLRSTSRTAHVAGVTAVALSLVQCGLGVWRSTAATGTTIAALTHTIDRIDGVKMLALALTIAAGTRALRATGDIGRPRTILGVLAAATLTVAGLAYLAAIDPLLSAAAPALVLLLAWVATIGFGTHGRAR